MSGSPPTSGCGAGTIVSTSGLVVSSQPVPLPLAPLAAAGGASVGAAATADHFCLRWNNYQTNMTTVFDQLLQEEVLFYN